MSFVLLVGPAINKGEMLKHIMDGTMETNQTTASRKILVVDDDPDIREIIMMVLESEGFTVSGLDNGSAVVETVEHDRPDIVLLDVQLGDCDGRDICRELKAEPATHDIPIIIISASHGLQGLREKQCNANDFLTKPFDLTELVDHVRRFCVLSD